MLHICVHECGEQLPASPALPVSPALCQHSQMLAGHDRLITCACRTERHKSKGMRHRRVTALAGTSAPSVAFQTPPLHPGKKGKKLAAAKAAKEAATTGKKARAKASAELTPAPSEKRQRVGLLPDPTRASLGLELPAWHALAGCRLLSRAIHSLNLLFVGSTMYLSAFPGRLRSSEAAA